MAPVPDAVDSAGPARPHRRRQRHEPALLEEMLIGWRMVPTLAASAPEALAALRAAQAIRQRPSLSC